MLKWNLNAFNIGMHLSDIKPKRYSTSVYVIAPSFYQFYQSNWKESNIFVLAAGLLYTAWVWTKYSNIYSKIQKVCFKFIRGLMALF